MKLHHNVALLAAAALLLGGCATAVPPVEVTRFHNTAPAWAPGTRYAIATAPLDGPAAGMPSLEWNSYRSAVDQQLQRQGLVAASSGERAPLLVRIDFARSERVNGGGQSPVSVGVGGSTGGYRSGVGLGIGFSLGGGPRRIYDVQLAVRIDDAASGNALWEGRALAAIPAKAPAAQPSLAAAKLADALFKDFPGESGRTISVP
jgi:hypothetical protein